VGAPLGAYLKEHIHRPALIHRSPQPIAAHEQGTLDAFLQDY